jgi:Fe2+ or Zn2+ uptake regulation protein
MSTARATLPPLCQTRQRAAVQDVVAAATRPPTPDEIRKAAARKVRGLGIATIYRTLRRLVDGGDAVVVDVPGAAPRYERAGRGHHHHSYCRACEQVFESTIARATAAGSRRRASGWTGKKSCCSEPVPAVQNSDNALS